VTVFLWERQTSYLAVPKAACTSIKVMLFAYENQRPWQPFKANGRTFHIHTVYRTLEFTELPTARIARHERLAVLRDPVKRLLSSFSNRVLHHRELSAQHAGPVLARHGLPPDPDLGQFIDRLEDYAAAVPSIFHHTRPMVDFLGVDPDYFAGLYTIERLDDFLAHLSRRLGQAMTLPRLQTGGPKLDPSILTGPQLAKLKKRYEVDYDLYGGWL
jgi:hypothetical protein